MSTFDLKITHGTLIDGTGAPARRTNLGIKDGKIVEIGACEGDARRTIDATGLIVTPGFIDIHTHFDGQASWDQALAPATHHGVTTAVMGNCGVGFAPVRAQDRQRLIDLMEGVEDIPGSALSEGISWDWESFPDYMSAIDALPHTIDLVAQVPHDALRVYVMGARATSHHAATDEDIAQMRLLANQALRAGAAGLSVGRTETHRSNDGSPTPSSEASERELRGLARAFEGLSYGVLQGVSDFDMHLGRERFEPEFALFESMIEASGGRPMSISLQQRDQDLDQWEAMVAKAEAINARGQTMKLQVAPRGIGVLLGLEATFHPFIGFPSYKAIAHLPLNARLTKMRDPAFRTQLLGESSDKVSGDGSPLPPLADFFLSNLEFVAKRLFRFHPGFDYEPGPTESIHALAKAKGTSFLAMMYDAMLGQEGRELLYFPLYNYSGQSLDVVHAMLSHPDSLLGLSDAGAHVSFVCDASFTTHLLTHWSRDRKGAKFTLEQAVKRLSLDNAQYMGLSDRGVLALGKRADLNVIDYDALHFDRPHMVADLPAGGRRLLQAAHGYRATVVAGEVILQDDQLTDARPGRVVRMGPDGPYYGTR